MKKMLIALSLLLITVVHCLGQGKFPLQDAYLRTNMDCSGFSITNFVVLSDTNGFRSMMVDPVTKQVQWPGDGWQESNGLARATNVALVSESVDKLSGAVSTNRTVQESTNATFRGEINTLKTSVVTRAGGGTFLAPVTNTGGWALQRIAWSTTNYLTNGTFEFGIGGWVQDDECSTTNEWVEDDPCYLKVSWGDSELCEGSEFYVYPSSVSWPAGPKRVEWGIGEDIMPFGSKIGLDGGTFYAQLDSGPYTDTTTSSTVKFKITRPLNAGYLFIHSVTVTPLEVRTVFSISSNGMIGTENSHTGGLMRLASSNGVTWVWE